jgi:DNA-directed RNA polymerase specialized sigma24 family protein
MEADRPVQNAGESPPSTGCRPTGTMPPNEAGAGAREVLLPCYWKMVYDHLRHRGYDREQAKDLTQGFFLEVVIERDLLGQADPARGPIRAFLFVALCRYLINVYKRENSCGRIPQNKLVPLDMIKPSRLAQDTPTSTRALCEYIWLWQTLAVTLEQIQTEYRKKGMLAHWRLFRECVLRPILEQTDNPPLKNVCRKYGIDETKASNMIVTVKRRLARRLTQHLRRLTISDEGAKSEIERIRGLACLLGVNEAGSYGPNPP